jgi:hypothetical protein
MRLGAGVFLLLILAFVWYSIAANYDYSILSGTYVFNGNGESCTLNLRADGTFEQKVNRSGEIQISHGYWRRYGEAHVSFSSEFMKLSGEEMNTEGQAHGQFEKIIGLFPTLTLAPIPSGPRFRKEFLI